MSVDKELLGTFIDEAHEHLDSIDNLLLDLEDQQFEDEGAVDELLRDLHSLKGSARMVGAESIEDVVHATESIIEDIVEGREDYTPSMMDMFFEVIDDLNTAVDEMVEQQELVEPGYLEVLYDKLSLFMVEDDGSETDEDDEPSTKEPEPDRRQELLELDYRELQELAKEYDVKANQSHEEIVEELLEEFDSQEDDAKPEGEGESPAAERPESPDAESSPEPEPDEDYLFEPWDPSENEELVEDYLAESKEMLNQLTNNLIELEQEQSAEKIDGIFRVAHTLKGSSGMIGLEVLEELAHDMEELLDDVRDGDLEVTAELIDLLLLCNDKIEEILDIVENLEPVQTRVKHLLEGIEEYREQGEVDVEAIRRSGSEQEEQAEQEASDEEDDEDADADGDSSSGSVTESIRVNIDKLDNVINLVGELVINRGRIEQKIEQLQELEGEIKGLEEQAGGGDQARRVDEEDGNGNLVKELKLFRRALDDVTTEIERSSDDISRVVSDLQESVMRTRMVPVAQLFNKFPRLVRDLSRETGKEVDLQIDGKDTEMDKTVIEKISDPLMHIIRNSVDHGIEPPDERTEAGKPREGKLSIDAGYEGDLVVITIEDDGGGINTEAVKETAIERDVITSAEAEEMSTEDIQQLIFEPGFSTKEEVSETSGRGVGMDVVRSNIRDLNGSVDLDSEEGEGTTFTIKLPLTVAIIQVLLVRIGERQFALPLSSVSETMRIDRDDIRHVGQEEVFELRGETLSLLRLQEVLGYSTSNGTGLDSFPVVVVKSGNQRLGILVHELLQKQEIVIKDLGTILDDVKYASGATIMGDGSVSLIVDLGEIVQDADKIQSGRHVSSGGSTNGSAKPTDQQEDESLADDSAPRVLVVEDSATQRQAIRSALENAGFQVRTAEHGEEGLEVAQEEQFDLVSSDVKMPFLNGYELTEELRGLPEYSSTPIMIVSSLDEKIDKMRGFDAGADDYLEKPFGNDELVNKVNDLLKTTA